MGTKVCSKCNITKNLNEFRVDNSKKDGLRPDCKDCIKSYELSKRTINPFMMRTKLFKFYENNPQKRKEYRDNYKVRKNQQKKERRQYDPVFLITEKVRTRLWKYLKINNITKKNKTFDIVGCSPIFLKEHLEKQFVDGMSWDNKGLWHIDHIIPLSSAKTEEELYKLCHYTNLQPLWAEDNLKKSNKIVEPFNGKK